MNDFQVLTCPKCHRTTATSAKCECGGAVKLRATVKLAGDCKRCGMPVIPSVVVMPCPSCASMVWGLVFDDDNKQARANAAAAEEMKEELKLALGVIEETIEGLEDSGLEDEDWFCSLAHAGVHLREVVGDQQEQPSDDDAED
jgi:hypothetical protein